MCEEDGGARAAALAWRGDGGYAGSVAVLPVVLAQWDAESATGVGAVSAQRSLRCLHSLLVALVPAAPPDAPPLSTAQTCALESARRWPAVLEGRAWSAACEALLATGLPFSAPSLAAARAGAVAGAAAEEATVVARADLAGDAARCAERELEAYARGLQQVRARDDAGDAEERARVGVSQEAAAASAVRTLRQGAQTVFSLEERKAGVRQRAAMLAGSFVGAAAVTGGP
jgi:hypothetical protein